MLPIGGSGPPPIPQGTGKWHLEMEEPFRLVNLDAAAFDWLWRVVENRARQHQEHLHTSSASNSDRDVHVLQAAVSLRAAIAFREAAGTIGSDPPVTKKRRRLVKQVPNQ